MKKRAISILLSICMLVGLLAGMTITASAAAGTFPLFNPCWPVKDARCFITALDVYSGGGEHRGIDIAWDYYKNETICPVADGEVVAVVNDINWTDLNSGSLGNYVLVQHRITDAQGTVHYFYSRYAHLQYQSVSVQVNQSVVAGVTKLGNMGNTGASDGEHLHLDMWEGGQSEYWPSGEKRQHSFDYYLNGFNVGQTIYIKAALTKSPIYGQWLSSSGFASSVPQGCSNTYYHFNQSNTAAIEPTISISGQTLPSNIEQGKTFILNGVVSTNVGTITHVNARLESMSGTIFCQHEVYPNAQSYDLRDSVGSTPSIDAKMTFNTLSAGSYQYVLWVRAVNGSKETTKDIIVQPFTVTGSSTPATTTTILPAAAVEDYAHIAEISIGCEKSFFVNKGMPNANWCGYFAGWWCMNESQIKDTLGSISTNDSGYCIDPAIWALQKNAGKFYILATSSLLSPMRSTYYSRLSGWVGSDSNIEYVDSFTPKRGDMILFNWSGDMYYDHVGVVTGSNKYIDGNSKSNTVALHAISDDAENIIGYFRFNTETPHTHTGTAHAAVAATCTAAGNSAYWSCSGCGKFFSDAACTKEISNNSWVINALGHNLVHHNAQAATCTEKGWSAYDTCSRCNYTTFAEIAALGHNLIHHDAKAPTISEVGWNAYDTCSRCGYSTYHEIPALEEFEIANGTLVKYNGYGGDIAIPESVTSIGGNAFYSCTGLASVTIPDSVTSIGNGAFADCTSLTDVYYNGTEAQWNEIDIGDNNDSILHATIHFLTIYKLGDVDGNGDIGASDAAVILKWCVATPEMKALLIPADKELAADVDRNGDIGASDAAIILRWCVATPEMKALLIPE